MAQPSRCTCPVCELEQAILSEINHLESEDRYRQFISRSPILSVFPTYAALSIHLRGLQTEQSNRPTSDEILRELFRLSRERGQELGHELILLILMPGIHKTTGDIAVSFPSLSREDVAQHLLTAILEILCRESFRTRQSHYAFALIRLMRRSAFRWAIRESKFASGFESERLSAEESSANGSNDFEARVVLQDFLHRCLAEGLLTETEYEQLQLFKLQGVSSHILAARAGLSEIAFRHRVQRVLEKLRHAAGKRPVLRPRRKSSRAASSTPSSGPEQTSAA